ncbi:MAG: ATP-binding protein [Pseudomonadota bacterium]
MDGLAAFQGVNFDWVMRLDDVWRDSPYDVPELNAYLRQAVVDRCRQIKDISPLGWVVLGPAGAGKTHLLGSLRRLSADIGSTFIMVDMTDVKDFWETVLLGCLSSLREPEAEPQVRRLLGDLLRLLGMEARKASHHALALVKLKSEDLVKYSTRVVRHLAARYRPKVIEHQDVIRALFLLNSEDFTLGNLGYSWLLGLELEPEEARGVGLRQVRGEPIKILRGLSWLISLRGPAILALDQLDAIVTEQHAASGVTRGDDPESERLAAQAIIEGLGRGLSALADHTTRTLFLISCLESTWNILRNTALRSSTDRFEEPQKLMLLPGPEVAAHLVEKRVLPAYKAAGFGPAYPTWPFLPQAFESAAGLTPREILKKCEIYRRRCLEEARVVELGSFEEIDRLQAVETRREDFGKIDAAYEVFKQRAWPHDLLDEDNEDGLGRLLQTALHCAIREAPLPDEVDVLLETQFGGGRSYPPLHARVSLVYVKRGAEERHVCFRVLQKLNPIAYQARLAAALTAAGIDKSLSFRRLFIIRTTPPPEGPRSRQATANLHKAGGRFHTLRPEELRALYALQVLDDDPPRYYEEWLQFRRPASELPIIKEALPELYQVRAEADRAERRPEPGFGTAGRLSSSRKDRLPLGRIVDGPEALKTLNLPLASLNGHAVILAGSGAGHDVLLRRLVEGAAISGAPSLVIDSSGHLGRLGQPWPETPRDWPGGEAARAKLYHERADVTLWTPGRDEGRPFSLSFLPDFGPTAEAGGEAPGRLDEMVELALANLQELLITGWSAKAKKMKVLTAACRHFGQNGGGKLADFIKLLSALPDQAGGHARSAQKLAQNMADQLEARLKDAPWLNGDGSGPGLASLFTTDGGSRTRVSVMSMLGLAGPEARRQFMTQLASALLVFIRENPAWDGGLKGLLVIEEAKDFLPAGKAAPCKTNLMRLAEQGRKSGLGIILATENPRDLDMDVLAHFQTWFYGRANSPQGLKLIRKGLQERGAAANNAVKLEPNQFYVFSAGEILEAQKIGVPKCLSYHPGEPLSPEQILAESRRVGG